MSKKMVFLYTGGSNQFVNGTEVPYVRYTDSDLMNFGADSSKGQVNEFVITGGNSLSGKNNVTAYVQELINLAKRVQSLTGKKVWFGTPRQSDPTSSGTLVSASDAAATNVNTFIDTLKTNVITQLGSAFWNNYVVGFYVNHEHIRHSGDLYGQDVSVNSPSSHPQIRMFQTISNKIHSLNKKILWVPYFGYGPTYQKTIESIGIVANRTNIFDYVLLQPHYYFQPNTDIRENLLAIRESIRLNKVVGRKLGGSYPVIGGSKTSGTKIGCQMEVDTNCFTGRSAASSQDAGTAAQVMAAYRVTENCFNNVATTGIPTVSGYNKANYDFSFYCSVRLSASDPNFIKVQQLINAFYKA